MSTATPRFRIVIALDLSEYSEIVLEHALDQAARHTAPDLHFLHVISGRHGDIDRAKKQLAELVLPSLDQLDCADWHVRLHVRNGGVAEEIAVLADEVNAHLVVIGRFGMTQPRKRIGATASRVIDRVPCPTFVVGLSSEPDAHKEQCPDCVAVRAESDGETWFCEAHRGDRARLSTMIVPGSSWRSGPMW